MNTDPEAQSGDSIVSKLWLVQSINTLPNSLIFNDPEAFGKLWEKEKMVVATKTEFHHLDHLKFVVREWSKFGPV